MNKKVVALISAAALSLAASENLKQNLDAGFTNTTGNSDTTNFNAKYSLLYKTSGYLNEPLNVKFSLSAFYAEDNGEKSNEEYTSSLDLDQYVYDGWMGYFSFDWLRNPDFKNYDGKYEFGIGAGKEVYKDDNSNLILKLGLGYNILDYADNTPTDRFASLIEEAEYNNRLNQHSLLYVKLKANEGFDDFTENYELSGSVGLKFDISEKVHVVLEEQVVYDNLPPKGYEKTDTKTIIRLGLTF